MEADLNGDALMYGWFINFPSVLRTPVDIANCRDDYQYRTAYHERWIGTNRTDSA